MRDMPLILKLIINLILYTIYVIFASVVFSFMFPVVLQVLGRDLIDYRDPVFTKIQIFIAIFVLLISLIFRKYFYISNSGKRDTVYAGANKNDTIVEKKVVQKPVVKKIQQKDLNDDEIKIYVEKEIK